MQIEPKQNFVITRQIGDPAETATLFVMAFIRDAKTDDLLNSVALTDKGDQRFRGTVEAPADSSGQGRYITICTKVFTDSNYLTESQLYGREEFTYLVQERPRANFGMGGGADVNYEKIRKMIKEELGLLPKPEKVEFPRIPQPKDVDLKPILKAIENIKFPEIPKQEKTDLSPVLKAINNIDIPEAVDLSQIDFSEVRDIVSGLVNKLDDFYKSVGSYIEIMTSKIDKGIQKRFSAGVNLKLFTPEPTTQDEENPTSNFKKYFK